MKLPNPSPSFRARGLRPRPGMTSGRKLNPRDRLQIAVPDLLLVGLRQVDAFENAQRLAGIHGAPLRIERAVGGEHDLVEVVERKLGMGRRHAAEYRGVRVE